MINDLLIITLWQTNMVAVVLPLNIDFFGFPVSLMAMHSQLSGWRFAN